MWEACVYCVIDRNVIISVSLVPIAFGKELQLE